ncbi:hypothetical protein [Paenibacillus sp.]|uniref:hypothetical protein n=1 Tax=Paenibacillus sp. TaxID=58172 RepID=UPI0028A741FA|nr:hypothetical protein [Paenibacillus sp.]
MEDSIAMFPFSGTASQTVPLSREASYLVIFNDGATDLTVTAGYFTTIVRAGDGFDERVNPFTTLSIVATGAYHGYCRVMPGGGR